MPPVPFDLPPPSDGDRFEAFCLDLWRSEWRDPNAQRNGRSGHAQNGVDIVGRRSGEDGWIGIQCKKRDGRFGAGYSARDLERAVDDARSFLPPLREFVLATTLPRNPQLQETARRITDANRARGEFDVFVVSWDDIAELLARHPKVLRAYYPSVATPRSELVLPTDYEHWSAERKARYLGTLVDLLGEMDYIGLRRQSLHLALGLSDAQARHAAVLLIQSELPLALDVRWVGERQTYLRDLPVEHLSHPSLQRIPGLHSWADTASETRFNPRQYLKGKTFEVGVEDDDVVDEACLRIYRSDAPPQSALGFFRRVVNDLKRRRKSHVHQVVWPLTEDMEPSAPEWQSPVAVANAVELAEVVERGIDTVVPAGRRAAVRAALTSRLSDPNTRFRLSDNDRRALNLLREFVRANWME